MKQGYMVGYSFNRCITLLNCAFLVQTSDKRVAQRIAKIAARAIYKKEWNVYRYRRTFTCKITEKNLQKYGNYPCYNLSWDRLGGTYRVWKTGNFKGAIV